MKRLKEITKKNSKVLVKTKKRGEK